MDDNKGKTNLKAAPKPAVRIAAAAGVFLLCAVLILLGVVWVLEKGPSPTATGTFTRSVRETSAIRWVSRIFLSEEELEQYKSVSTEEQETAEVNTSLIHMAEARETEEGGENLEVLDISAGSCKGKLMIVHDPRTVILGTSEKFEEQPGLLLTEMVEKYHAVGGINAGGFNDEGGRGDGGTPEGLVISDGVITWGSRGERYNIVGLDEDGYLHIGNMSGGEALEQGIRWAVSFVTHDGLSSALIINGEIQTQNLGGGVNPRTAIGQRKDGALLLLVLDGRSISTLGASIEDICNIMLEYGAVNAGNLDGGSSSVMVYGGEIINNCASVVGPRKIPTAFLVLEEGDAHD